MGRMVTARGSACARLGMGCVKLGTVVGPAAGRRLVRAALDEGVTFFDTADAYGAGASERVLGSAIRSERSQVLIATKGGYVFSDRNMVSRAARRAIGPAIRRVRRSGSGPTGGTGRGYARQDFSAAYLRRAVDGSLRRLRTDYIDLYQFHGPREIVDEDVTAMMENLIRSGKVRRFGVGLEQLDGAVGWLRTQNISSLQVPFGPLDPQARADVFEAAERAGVRLVCRGVLGSGLFGATAAASGDPNAAKIELVSAMARLGSEYGVSAHQLAVWWVLADRRVDTMLIGLASDAHLRSTVEMVTTPCESVELLTRLDHLIATHHLESPSR